MCIPDAKAGSGKCYGYVNGAQCLAESAMSQRESGVNVWDSMTAWETAVQWHGCGNRSHLFKEQQGVQSD